MKRFLTLILLMAALPAFVAAQILGVTVDGVIVDANGNGVPNVVVTITDVPYSGSYTATETTDIQGYFNHLANLNTTQGMIDVDITDCNGNLQTATGSYFPGQMDITVTLLHCGGTGTGCQADFNANVVGMTVDLVDNSSGTADTYAWDFGDGTTSALQNPVHTYASNGTYNICLDVTSTTDPNCSDTYCESVTIGGGMFTHTLFGDVGYSGTIATAATVYLIEYDPNLGGQLISVATTTLVNGGFSFTNVPAGDYLIKAALDPADPQYANYMPTYLVSSLFWSGALQVSTANIPPNPAGTYVGAIQMIAGTNPGGPGFVGGLVIQGANKSAGPGDPIPDASVILMTSNDDPVAETMTNSNGEYSFDQIAHGDYKVRVEIVGLSSEEYEVTIDANNESDDGADFEVNTTGIMLLQTNSISDQVKAQGLRVYPTQVQNVVNLHFGNATAGDLTVNVVNTLGQMVKTMNYTLNGGQQTVQMDMSDAPAGVYFIEARSEAGTQSFKVLKAN